MKGFNFKIFLFIMVFMFNYLCIAQEGQQKESQDSLKEWGEGENFDVVVKDGILLTSLIQLYDKNNKNIFNSNAINSFIAKAMLVALGFKYDIKKFDFKTSLILPQGVKSIFNDTLFIYESDTTWFNPLKLFLNNVGKFENFGIRGSGYNIIKDRNGRFKVKIKDGMEAKIEATKKIFKNGKWVKVEKDE